MTNFDFMSFAGLGVELVLCDGRTMRGTLITAPAFGDEITLEVGPGNHRTVKTSDVRYGSLSDTTESYLIGPEPKSERRQRNTLHVVPVRTISVLTLSKIFHPNPTRSDRLTLNRSGYIIYIS